VPGFSPGRQARLFSTKYTPFFEDEYRVWVVLHAPAMPKSDRRGIGGRIYNFPHWFCGSEKGGNIFDPLRRGPHFDGLPNQLLAHSFPVGHFSSAAALLLLLSDLIESVEFHGLITRLNLDKKCGRKILPSLQPCEYCPCQRTSHRNQLPVDVFATKRKL
jgi:hypothetical protein